MAYFAALRQSFSAYFSPIKKPKQRSTSPKTTSRPLCDQLDRRSMTPGTRTSTWLSRLTPCDSTKSPSLRGVKGSKIGKTPMKKAVRKPLTPRELEDDSEDPDATLVDEEIDIEGDTTLVDDGPTMKNKIPGEWEWTEEDEAEWFQEQQERLKNKIAERQGRVRDSILPNQDRSEREHFLREKIRLRGFEPLLPNNWILDFPTYPLSLFAEPKDYTTPFIKALNPNKEFRAIKALDDLATLGTRARDKLLQGQSATHTIYRGLKAYLKWAFEDANLSTKSFNGIHTIIEATTGEPAHTIVKKTTDELIFLRSTYWSNEDEDTLSDLPSPTFYGIIVTHTLLYIVTLPPDAPEIDAEVNSIGLFDFKTSGADVWNALGFAITIMCIRNDVLATGHVKEYADSTDDVDA
ncbi:MAG: hypothetical protein M1834_005269 [Cirrosporium novae-zelandiae]|nr:MAG: hypothetical protein M1834_005269 [Cirrosporium novae-zelandiae]